MPIPALSPDLQKSYEIDNEVQGNCVAVAPIYVGEAPVMVFGNHLARTVYTQAGREYQTRERHLNDIYNLVSFKHKTPFTILAVPSNVQAEQWCATRIEVQKGQYVPMESAQTPIEIERAVAYHTYWVENAREIYIIPLKEKRDANS